MENKKLTKKNLLDLCKRDPPYLIINEGCDNAHTIRIGVPQMLITTLCQFTGKQEDNLQYSDALKLHNLIENLGLKADTVKSKYWKNRPKEIKFFGWSQYGLLSTYIKSG